MYLDGELLDHSKGAGRPSLFSGDDKVQIIAYLHAYPFHSWSMVIQRLGLDCVKATVQNIASEFGLFRRKARKVTKLSELNKANRLTFAQQFSNWSESRWSNTVYGDEVTFCVDLENSVYVTRPVNEAFNPKYTVKNRKMQRLKWNVLAFCVPSSNYLVFRFFTGNMNKEKFADLLIAEAPNVENLLNGPDDDYDFVYILDNASYHNAAYVQTRITNYNQSHQGTDRLTLLDWPAYFQDINVLENMFGSIKKRLHQKIVLEQLECSNLAQFKQLILDSLEQFKFDNDLMMYGASVPTRLAEIIKNNGDFSGY
ncbi:Transposable element Tc1 transposase [Halotydeus destructor]|nr:Transposable element Tc1 transposase [Halotydeus destructor]